MSDGKKKLLISQDKALCWADMEGVIKQPHGFLRHFVNLLSASLKEQKVSLGSFHLRKPDVTPDNSFFQKYKRLIKDNVSRCTEAMMTRKRILGDVFVALAPMRIRVLHCQCKKEVNLNIVIDGAWGGDQDNQTALWDNRHFLIPVVSVECVSKLSCCN